MCNVARISLSLAKCGTNNITVISVCNIKVILRLQAVQITLIYNIDYIL